MIIKDPYKTTYGSVISIAKIKEELVKYISLEDINTFNYEYINTGDVKIVFITGYNSIEKELPLFDHPVLIKDMRGNEIVVTDIRKYVTTKDTEQPTNISDIVKDKGNFEFILLRALLTRDICNDEVGTHRSIFKGIASGFAVWMSNVINGIVGLDPVEKVKVEIVSNLYVNTMTVQSDDLNDMASSLLARTSKAKYSIRLTTKMINDILHSISVDMSNLESYIDVVKTVIDDNKAELVSVDSFVNVVSNGWYGPGNNETLIIATEHLPTLMTLIYGNLENKGFKRTQLASLLTKNKNNIDGNVIIKYFDNYLKDSKY